MALQRGDVAPDFSAETKEARSASTSGGKVIGLAVDSVESPARWEGDIADATGHARNSALIADPDRKVCELYGMIHHASATSRVRSGL